MFAAAKRMNESVIAYGAIARAAGKGANTRGLGSAIMKPDDDHHEPDRRYEREHALVAPLAPLLRRGRAQRRNRRDQVDAQEEDETADQKSHRMNVVCDRARRIAQRAKPEYRSSRSAVRANTREHPRKPGGLGRAITGVESHAYLHLPGRTPMPKTSDRIRARLLAAGERFRANDNIARFIEPGEIEALTEEVAAQVDSLLQSLVIDTQNDHNTRETGERVARMYLKEIFAGRYEPSPDLTAFPKRHVVRRALSRRPITIRSTCAHHLQNIRGNCWIGIYPGQERPRAVQVLPPLRVDHRAAADPGGNDDPDRRPRGAGDFRRRRGRRRESRAHVRHASRRARARVRHDDVGARGSLRENSDTRAEFFRLLQGMKGFND
jgi:GTP cyclohydrolase I